MSISSQVQEYPFDAIISFQRSSLVLFLVSLGVFLLPRVFISVLEFRRASVSIGLKLFLHGLSINRG